MVAWMTKCDTEINAVHSVIMGIGWRNVKILLAPLDVWMLLYHGIVMIVFFYHPIFTPRVKTDCTFWYGSKKKWWSVD